MRELIEKFISEFHSDGYGKTSVFGLAHSLFEQKKGAFSVVSGRNRFNDSEHFLNLINTNVCNKFCAVNYHFQNAQRFEKAIDSYSKQIIALGKELEIDSPITVCLSTTKLQLEYESFILQCRACLDHFVFSVSYYFGIETPRIDKLRNELNNRPARDKKSERSAQIT